MLYAACFVRAIEFGEDSYVCLQTDGGHYIGVYQRDHVQENTSNTFSQRETILVSRNQRLFLAFVTK